MNVQPRPRCGRCDEPCIERVDHTCTHGALCLPFTQPGHCLRCASFKSKQANLYDPDEPPKPFIKWVGGKRQLVPQLMRFIPRFSGTYHEPFAGGAALFFAMRPRVSVLSDANSRLVRTYRAIQADVERVIDKLESYPVDKGFYLDLRSIDIDASGDDVEVAAWFIYLNKCGYNGMYRVNKSGRFNVPWGKKKPDFQVCDRTTLRACSGLLKHSKVLCTKFDTVISRAKKGDFVYFDPPYVPVSKSANFTSYTKNGFGLEEHRHLASVALKLKDRGVHVLITNSDTEEVREIFSCTEEFTVYTVDAKGLLAANPNSRGRRTDLVIV